MYCVERQRLLLIPALGRGSEDGSPSLFRFILFDKVRYRLVWFVKGFPNGSLRFCEPRFLGRIFFFFMI
jgi:hypothetical protein